MAAAEERKAPSSPLLCCRKWVWPLKPWRSFSSKPKVCFRLNNELRACGVICFYRSKTWPQKGNTLFLSKSLTNSTSMKDFKLFVYSHFYYFYTEYEVFNGWGAQVRSRPQFFSEHGKLPWKAFGLYDISCYGSFCENVFCPQSLKKKWHLINTLYCYIFIFYDKTTGYLNNQLFHIPSVMYRRYLLYFQCKTMFFLNYQYMAEMTCENKILNKETDGYFF